MKILKKILFPIFSLFLVFRTIELIKNLSTSNPNDFSFLEFLVISFLLTLFITGVFAFLGFAYPTSKFLPDDYYKIKNPKRLNQLYKILGVKYFRIFLLLIFWGRNKNRQKYFDGNRKGLLNFIYQAKQSEFGHLSALVSILIVSVYLLVHGYTLLSTVITLLNIIGNLYPVLLQRYHRIRIEKITRYNKI